MLDAALRFVAASEAANLCNGAFSLFVLLTFTTSCGNVSHNLIMWE